MDAIRLFFKLVGILFYIYEITVIKESHNYWALIFSLLNLQICKRSKTECQSLFQFHDIESDVALILYFHS